MRWPPEELWRTNVGFGVSAPLLVKGRVYVMGWELDSGKLNWESGDIFEENHEMGAEVGNLLITSGDDKMIIWDGIKQGNLVLADASPDSSWKELARVNGVFKKSACEQGYPHVVFCDGKILCRNMEGDLVCLSVQKGPEEIELNVYAFVCCRT